MRLLARYHKQRLAFVGVIVLLMVALAGCGGGTPAVSGSISGSVVDIGGGAVAYAAVVLGDHKATSSADGKFALSGVPTGVQTLFISKAGFKTKSVQVTVVASATTDVGQIALERDGTQGADLSLINARTGSMEGGVGEITVPKLAAGEHVVIIPYARLIADGNYAYSLSAGLSSGATVSASVPRVLGPLSAGDSFRGYNWGAEKFIREQERELFYANLPGGFFPTRRTQAIQPALALGSTQQFWVLNSQDWPPQADDWAQVTATLKGLSDSAYVYVDQNAKTVPDDFADEVAKAFDSISAKDRNAFGSEPSPGIDNDSHIFILFSPVVNQSGMGGYFSSVNEYPASEVSKWTGGVWHSNEKEMFYVSVPDSTPTAYNRAWTKSCLAHEFQHMINYYQHKVAGRDYEEPWVNEGLSVLAEDVAGYGYHTGSNDHMVAAYLENPAGFSLTNWVYDSGSYGMSYLFMRYLFDRFQNIDTRRFVQTSLTGVANVEDRTGHSMAELYRDWVAALYLSNLNVTSDPRFNYTSINLRSKSVAGYQYNGPATSGLTLPGSVNGTLKAWGPKFMAVPRGDGSDLTLSLTADPASNVAAAIIRY